MREIKFRGKANISIQELNKVGIKHDNGWVYGNLIVDGKAALIVGGIEEVDDEYVDHEWWVTIDINTIGQYTGLKDKNGIEIYEGDILTVPDIRGYTPGAVKFGLHHAKNGWYVEWANKIKGELNESWNWGGGKVIGNIYENPELLEGKR